MDRRMFFVCADDDFREFVGKLPEGCRITIVSDSCHSGGLIDESKEQIGESTKQAKESSDPGFSFMAFLKQQIHEAFEFRDIHIPHEGHHHHPSHEAEDDDRHGRIRNRSLPMSALIEILKQKTGRQDIHVGNIRPTLFDVFGEEASPKVKKFVKVIMDKLQKGPRGEGACGLRSIVGNLELAFLKNKLEENDEEYVKPAMKTEVSSAREVHAGSNKGGLPDNGILISGCQTDQTSADASSPDGAYGALSNAIQTILEETDGEISNQELVLRARKMLAQQGFTQRPGLYCSDKHVGAPFVCP